MNDLVLKPWEVAALDAMEIERLRVLNASKEDEGKDVVAERPMSMALLDALF